MTGSESLIGLLAGRPQCSQMFQSQGSTTPKTPKETQRRHKGSRHLSLPLFYNKCSTLQAVALLCSKVATSLVTSQKPEQPPGDSIITFIGHDLIPEVIFSLNFLRLVCIFFLYFF